MKQRTKSNILFIAAILLTFLLIASPFISGFLNRAATKYPDIINGSADFSETRHTTISTLYLSGEWEVFENSHIMTNGITTPGEIQQTPSKLTTALQRTTGASGSQSSYRMTIKNLDFENAVVYIPHFAGAYRIFLNNKLISESGILPNGETQANLHLNAVPVNFKSEKDYTLVVEVSCKLMPGLYMSPIIADYTYANDHSDIAEVIRCIVFGIVIFCSFFILMYSIHKKYLFNSKWFPLLSLFIGLRMILSTDGYSAFHVLFGSIDYEYLTLLICLSTFIIKIIALFFYTETLNLQISKGVFIAFCSTSFLGAIIISLIPSMVFNPYWYVVIQMSTLPFDIVILGHLADSVARKTPYSITYSLGYIAIISGIMVDCFYTNGLLPFIASSFMPIAFAISVLFFTAIFSQMHTAMYNAAIKSAELDRELTAANTSIMISQIQPHFLYNALNTIKYLIKRDPKTAEKAVISFSKYLRGNMESITNNSPIPFSDELEHIKNYCDIELLRFGDKIDIVYNTDFTSFVVPALSIQPLVENAIKHGVTKKPEGGTVTVTSFEDQENYVITIEDDGIGFDPENPDYSDDGMHAHLGIQNLKSRLQLMVNATLEIQSKPMVGTTVTVKIPKEETK